MSRPSLAVIAPGLTQGADGIWYATERETLSYPEDGNDACLKVEERSFWFRHRNACITRLMQVFPPAGPLFDVGGGNGFVSLALERAGFPAVLVEPGPAGARNGQRRGLAQVVCATTEGAGFLPGSLPAVGLFDVVEHIEDDDAFLRHIHGLLQPDGRVYLTVPAFQWLWSQEDVHAGHFRRYTLGEMSGLLRRCGFEVEFASYFFRFLPLSIALLRALPYRLGLRRDEVHPDPERAEREHRGASGGLASRLLERLLQAEVERLGRPRRMGFGGSCLLVARRRATA